VVSRGDVWWYEPPDAKRRPALVMTRAEAAQSLNELFVILATTTVRGLPTEVELGPQDGMPRDCVLNADHAGAADKAFLTERIARLGPERMVEVCRALAFATSC
jgi:mRNA interferase MazF